MALKRWASLLCFIAFVSQVCGAQIGMQSAASSQVAGVVAGTGQLGQYYSYAGFYFSPSSHTVDWSYAGAGAAACNFQVEGSSDHVHWYPLTGPTDCTTGNMIHIANKPVVYLRINILTYTAGGGTALTFNYTRGQ